MKSKIVYTEDQYVEQLKLANAKLLQADRIAIAPDRLIYQIRLAFRAGADSTALRVDFDIEDLYDQVRVKTGKVPRG